jgi:hypothetical protein
MKHGKNPKMEWFPLYSEKWLFGSTRYELEHAERAIFVDLLAIANRDEGYIRANENFAYTTEHLAGMLGAGTELIDSTIQKCLGHNKLEKLDNNILRVTSWDVFSLTARRKRQVESFPKKRKCTSAKRETPLISSPLISLSSTYPLSWEGIKGEDMSAWGIAYPACDINRELAAMLEWIKSNPQKGKKKNYRRFIVNWLARAQERGGGMKSNPPRQVEIERERAVGATAHYQFTPEQEARIPAIKKEYRDKIEKIRKERGLTSAEDVDPFEVPTETEYVRQRLAGGGR